MAVKVLWVIKGLGPGGAETLLAHAAAAHDRSRFDIECAFVLPHKDHLAERLESAGVTTRCVSRRRVDPGWPIRLWILVRSGGYDVVHVHSPLPGSVARLAARLLLRRRPRLVTTEHNSWRTFSPATRVANRMTSVFDDETFTVSDEVRLSVRGRAGRSARTLVHGIEIQAVAAARGQRNSVRAELGLGSSDFVIGTVANFRPQKDYPTLLRAVRLYLDAGGTAKWVIVGQGPLESEVRELAEQLGLSEQVIFTGFRADAVRVQSSFDVFTLASRWEGLPVALMEACALGTPVVATAVGGVREVLSDGETALLVQPGDVGALADSWRQLASDAVLRQRFSLGALAVADAFDIRRAVAVIEAAYSRNREQKAGVQRIGDASVGGTSSSVINTGLEIRPLAEGDEADVLRLMNRCLGWHDDPRYGDLYRWKHAENPFGGSFGWVATDGGRVVAVRLFMRWDFVRGTEVLRAVRAVDTATDPEYQGRGLFTSLTMHGLEHLREAGIDFVFNTPNEQSLPGYLKMGWREVGRLNASFAVATARSAVSLVTARVPAELWSSSLEIGESISAWLETEPMPIEPMQADPRRLATARSHEFLRWRYGNELLGYRIVRAGSELLVVRARRRGNSNELVIADTLSVAGGTSGSSTHSVLRLSGADHALRLGKWSAREGFWPVPGSGPLMTWRAVTLSAMPPISNWDLTLGDVELF